MDNKDVDFIRENFCEKQREFCDARFDDIRKDLSELKDKQTEDLQYLKNVIGVNGADLSKKKNTVIGQIYSIKKVLYTVWIILMILFAVGKYIDWKRVHNTYQKLDTLKITEKIVTSGSGL